MHSSTLYKSSMSETRQCVLFLDCPRKSILTFLLYWGWIKTAPLFYNFSKSLTIRPSIRPQSLVLFYKTTEPSASSDGAERTEETCAMLLIFFVFHTQNWRGHSFGGHNRRSLWRNPSSSEPLFVSLRVWICNDPFIASNIWLDSNPAILVFRVVLRICCRNPHAPTGT
jgi:hypothetical protein